MSKELTQFRVTLAVVIKIPQTRLLNTDKRLPTVLSLRCDWHK